MDPRPSTLARSARPSVICCSHRMHKRCFTGLPFCGDDARTTEHPRHEDVDLTSRFAGYRCSLCRASAFRFLTDWYCAKDPTPLALGFLFFNADSASYRTKKFITNEALDCTVERLMGGWRFFHVSKLEKLRHIMRLIVAQSRRTLLNSMSGY